MNKVVARFADGRMLKGVTADFFPAKDRFHVIAAGEPAGAAPIEVFTADLKALFFVKDFAGNPKNVEPQTVDPARAGRRIKVVFKDGEVLVGTTTGYQPGRAGFFLELASPDSNNVRCYIVTAATREISFL